MAKERCEECGCLVVGGGRGGGGGGVRVGLGIFKRKLPPLGRAPFVGGLVHMRVKYVRAIGLQMSDRIGSGIEVHPLAPVYAL